MLYYLVRFKEPMDSKDLPKRSAIVVGPPDLPTALHEFRKKHPNAEQVQMITQSIDEVIIVR